MKKLIMAVGYFFITGFVILFPILLTLSIVYKWHGFIQVVLGVITSCEWVGLIDAFWLAAEKGENKK